MLSKLKIFPENVKFPCLIHFDQAGFDKEVEEIAQDKAATAAKLEALIQSLSSWKGESVDKESLLDYLHRGNFKTQLTEFFRKAMAIPQQVRLDKINEVYAMPDMAGLLALSEGFSTMGADEIETYFQSETIAIKPPKITASEKSALKAKYSFFVRDAAGLKTYMALRLLCETTNLVNNDIEAGRTSPQIEFVSAKNYIPSAFKYLKKNYPNPESRKYILEIDYHALK